MGPSESKAKQQIDLSLNHPRFSSAKFVTDGKTRHMQTIMGIDNKVYDRWKDNLAKRPLSKNLLLPVNHNFASKGLCGSSGILTLDYENYPYLLTEEMLNHRGKRKLFQQNQIWYLLFALISAKRSMNPPFSKIGDVRPHNIFINDKGEIQVANIFSWPNQLTNFSKSFENQATYIAPEELKQLEISSPESDKNHQSELFSIGLTLLSAATLQDFSSAYDIKKFSINQAKINEKLNQFKVNRAYSDILKGVVCNLCEYDQSKRITSEQLWNWISPHQQKILARTNFYIPSAPQKIHQEVSAVRQAISQLTGTSFVGNRQTSTSNVGNQAISGQKLNFPPPIIRNTILDPSQLPNNINTPTGATNAPVALNSGLANNSVVTTYTSPGLTGISTNVWNAESVYIPSTKLAQIDPIRTSNEMKTTAQFGGNTKPAETNQQQLLTPRQDDGKSGSQQKNNSNTK